MRLLTLLGAGLLGAGLLSVGSASAALLFLDSGGEGSVDLAPGESVEINIMLTMRDIDPGFIVALVSLDDDDNSADGEMEVTAMAPNGDPDENGPMYDRSHFTLPAEISWDSHNEFEVIMYSADETNWGGDGTEATFLVDTLTVTHTGSSTQGTVPVTFELGASFPAILSEGYVIYVWGVGFDGLVSGFIDPGVGAADNPFIINLVPNPECEGDANGDGTVDPLDNGFVLARFGCEVDAGDPDCDAADQNGDGTVNPLDSGFVLARFGTCN